MEIIDLVLLLLLGWFAYRFLVTLINVKEAMDRIDEAVEEATERITRNVYVEVLYQDSGKLYLAYDAKNHLFLGQGTDATELAKSLRTRFPSQLFTLSYADIEDLRTEGNVTL